MGNNVQTTVGKIVGILPANIKTIMLWVGVIIAVFVVSKLIAKKFFASSQWAQIDGKTAFWGLLIAAILITPNLMEVIAWGIDGAIYLIDQGIRKVKSA